MTAYLFWQNTKPVLEVRCDFKKKTALCGELVPTARVAARGPLRQPADSRGIQIKEEPVYFDARVPRKYDRMEAEIEYADLRHDLLEFGVARDEAKKNFEFVSLENKILDNLAWQKIEGGGTALYQRKFAYQNIGKLKEQPPDFTKTLVYRADIRPQIGDLKNKGETVIDFPVVGGINFFVYHKGGAPEARVEGAEPQIITNKIGENLYKVEIKGAAEAVFTKIIINSPYVAIADKIKIGHLQKPFIIYFAGSRLLANAYAAGGAQKIDANGQIINIKKIKEQYISIFKNIKLRPVEIPKGEAELGGTLFFLNDKNIFYPRYEPFYAGADLSKINYIITGYKTPEGVAEKIARADFNIKDIPTPDRKLRFIISLPNAAKGDLVKIKSIKLKFIGERLGLSELFEKLKIRFSLKIDN